MLTIHLPYPATILWPNGRGHRMAKAREFKKHKHWAEAATMEAITRDGKFSFDCELIPIHIIVSRKSSGPYPDRDNTISAAKSALDGIAERLGINDKHFAAPTVEFLPEIKGEFVILVGERV